MKLRTLLLILFSWFLIGVLVRTSFANHEVKPCNQLSANCGPDHVCNFQTGWCQDAPPEDDDDPPPPPDDDDDPPPGVNYCTTDDDCAENEYCNATGAGTSICRPRDTPGGRCTRAGCGGTNGCPYGQFCSGPSGFMSCGAPPSGQTCPQDPNTCNGAGQPCSPCCKPGLTCSPDNNNRCLPPGDIVCHTNGCSVGECGYGYRCENSRCLVDASCARDTIDVPYTGPKITSFANLMSRLYNILFPAAILYGVIMVLKAGYILMTSEGNPQKTRLGQEDLTAAIMGTAFVVLSAAILRIIIVQFLGGSVGF